MLILFCYVEYRIFHIISKFTFATRIILKQYWGYQNLVLSKIYHIFRVWRISEFVNLGGITQSICKSAITYFLVTRALCTFDVILTIYIYLSY